VAYKLAHTTRRVSEKEAFESLGLGGLIYRTAREVPLIQLNACRGLAENRLDNLTARLDRPRDLFRQQTHPAQLPQPYVIQLFLPPAQRFEPFVGQQRKVCQFEVDLLQGPGSFLDLA